MPSTSVQSSADDYRSVGVFRLCGQRKEVFANSIPEWQFLGFVVDSVKATLSFPSHKLVKIKHKLRRTLSRLSISLHQLAGIMGLLSSSMHAIFPSPLHYRVLQHLKIFNLQRGLTYPNLFPSRLKQRRDCNGVFPLWKPGTPEQFLTPNPISL